MLNNNHNHHPNSTATTTTATTYATDLTTLGLHHHVTEDSQLPEEPEQVPTHLNTINSSAGFLTVSTDMLSVHYTYVGIHGHDVGVVQGNCPAPSRRMVYYFEMFVKNAGEKGRVCIGFTNDGFKMRRQPGWEPNSIGYHGDDGMLYLGQGKGAIFGPTFTTGDTVGGGINYVSQKFFFTKNGKLVGTSPKELKITLFPTIAVHSQNEEVHVNFGQQSFVFDVEAYEMEERLKQQLDIEKNPLPVNINHWIIRSYLQHYGYQETLNAFNDTIKSSLSPPVAQENGFDGHEEMYALSERKILRQLIRSGDIDSASAKLREWYPQILKDGTSTICFLLHCQKFIELVQSGLLEESVKFAQTELAKFFGIEPLEGLLEDVIALLAYEEPLKSSVAYLLGDAQRDVTADAVNIMVLLTNPEKRDSHSCVQSPLERILKQLTACSLETRASNGDQGEVFNLQKFLESGKR